MKGREVQLVRYPDGEVVPSDFRVVEVDVPAAGRRARCWCGTRGPRSMPGLRLRLRAKGPEGYFTAFPREAPMEGIMTVGEVVESRADGFDGWRHRLARVGLAGLRRGRGRQGSPRRDRNADEAGHGGRSPPAYLGVLGGNGLTAYAGLFHVAGLREGDVVWVSAAAGAVGSLVAQLAKIRGHRVVASAGSDEKVAWLREELGVDAAFNYRSGPLPELLREAAPDGIDVYFDNVGGDHLEAAIGALRRFGRVAICGAISEYDDAIPPPGPSNLFLMVAKDLTIRGFRGSSYVHLFAEMSREMGRWLGEGRIRYRETIVDGLEHAPEALASLMRGDTTGKTLVRI